MKYKAQSITDRIEKIKKTYLNLAVPLEKDSYKPKKYKNFCTGDRFVTLGYLRGWYKHSDAMTTRLRTSYAEAEELYESEAVIYEDELLLGHLYLPEYSTEEQDEYDRLCEMFVMSSHTLKERAPRKDHISLDFEKLLNLGINGIKQEIYEKIDELDFKASTYPDYSQICKYEFYNCCIIELDAVLSLAKKYEKKAIELAEKANEPRKSELLNLAKIMNKVPAEPASTFYEAIQSVQFFLSTLFGLYPLGRPDRYLLKFYQNDIADGTITKEFAQELIDNFCLMISDRVFSRAACGFMVGGQDEKGNLIENDLTYMFLTALDHLHLPDPNGALAVNKKTSDEILEYSAEILSHGTTHPAFYNDDAIVDSLVNNYSVSREDAVNYIHTTCAEISVIGKTRAHTTPISVDLPRILCESVTECGNATNIDLIIDSVIAKVKEFLNNEMLTYEMRMLEASRIGNEPMRIATLIDDCIERGKGIFEGGERYTFIQPIFVGFATMVDSLLAINNLVFDRGILTLSELKDIVEKNYAENERIRQYIINKSPHYGNDNKGADDMAKKISNRLISIFSDGVIMSENMMPGTFSYVNHAELGEKMGATFDGRKAGYSYSDGCSAVQGRDTNGPTAMILSLTSWEQSKLLGGMVVNLKLGKEMLTAQKKHNFVQLLKVFIERGGIEMQVNVTDRKTLEDAVVNPENHSDLIVRIGGYSDYFVRLSPVMQQEIIDRTEY